jgi:hypothetical protein
MRVPSAFKPREYLSQLSRDTLPILIPHTAPLYEYNGRKITRVTIV